MTDVFIGGFAGSKRQARRVADALAEYGGVERANFDAMSFAEAMEVKERTVSRIAGRRVFTHSAGMLAARGIPLPEIIAIAPPTPTSPLTLLGRAGLKSIQMTASAFQSKERLMQVVDFTKEQSREMIHHPWKNLRHLGTIAAHDAVKPDSEATRVTLGFMSNDAFRFMLPEEREIAAAGSPAVVTLTGEHDELILDPQAVMVDLDRQLKKN